MIPASEVLNPASATELVLTDEENGMQESLVVVWKGIINREIDNDTDFFKAGAGSMDVVRFVCTVYSVQHTVRSISTYTVLNNKKVILILSKFVLI